MIKLEKTNKNELDKATGGEYDWHPIGPPPSGKMKPLIYSIKCKCGTWQRRFAFNHEDTAQFYIDVIMKKRNTVCTGCHSRDNFFVVKEA